MLDHYSDILTVPEVCVILSICATKVYRLLNSGELKGFRCNKSWRVRKADLIKFVDSNCDANR